MLNIAIVLFIAAALSGLYLALQHFQDKPVAIPLALPHGLFSAGGLVLLLVAGFQTKFAGMIGVAAVLFVAAALGGFVLFGLHLKGRKLPKSFIAVHALAAVAAFVLTLVYAFA